MRLKSFQAESMSAAMRLVKDNLGTDAIIVSSREEKSGWVRVTAAIEKLPATHTNIPTFNEDTVIEAVTENLLKHRVPSDLSDKIIAAAAAYPKHTPRTTLSSALEQTLSFEALTPKENKPIILVGPPGAGKTLMTAKLAAESVLSGQRPTIITTDITRAGGIEQLEAFLDILALPLHQADSAESLNLVLEKVPKDPQIIIDTGGLNPFDPQEMKSLAQILAITNMETALVLPAGMDSEESADMAMAFSVLGVQKLIPTRLDFARRLGGILNAADKANLTLTEGSHTPQVANGIIQLTPEKLSEFLMPKDPPDTPTKRGAL